MFIPFKKYAPDLPAYKSEGMVLAQNTLPGFTSYLPFPAPGIASAAMDARVRGGTFLKDDAGDSYNYAGTETKLYRIETDKTVTDISKAGGYNTQTEDVWNFIQWNQDLIATNFAEPIQSISVPDGTLFADLSANAPKTRYLARVKDFLVAFNTQDTTDGFRPTRVWNSALNDTSSWTATVTTQANFVDLDTSDGDGQGITGGEYGVLFQERAITRMTYVGAPEIWRFDVVERGRGTRYPNSIVQFGNLVAYLGLDGFYIFDGQSSTPIGDGEINQTILNDIDHNFAKRVVGTLDPVNKYIIWAYPAKSSSFGNGIPNKIVCFNFNKNTLKRWTITEQEVQTLAQSASPGYTLDGLDSVDTNLDTLPFSLDSPVWQGGSLFLSGYNTDNKLVHFAPGNSYLTSKFITEEFEFFEGKRTLLNRIRLMVDGDDNSVLSVRVGYRNNLTESVTWTNPHTPTENGDVALRANGRYLRVELTISGGYKHAQGFEVLEMVEGGVR